jgi:hypothetical protein
MSFLVTIEGIVAYSRINTVNGPPAHVHHWPAAGVGFTGSFLYTPGATLTPALLTKIFVDFGSFKITRPPGIGAITSINGGAGIEYADSDSLGLTNVSLPAGDWELEAFDLVFANPTNLGPPVNPAALKFDHFTERRIYAAGIKGPAGSSPPVTLTWAVLARIDRAVARPA